MKSAILVLILSLTSVSAFSNDLDVGLIREGLYISTALNPEACTASLTFHSHRWGRKLYTLEVGQQNPGYRSDLGDYVVFHAKSDAFYLDDLKKQIQNNNGDFRYVTKKNQITENVISGQMYEENATTYLKLRVSNKTCIGFCSSKTAACTLRLN